MRTAYVALCLAALIGAGGLYVLSGESRIAISSVTASFGGNLNFQIQNLGNGRISGIELSGEIVFRSGPNAIMQKFTFERYVGALYGKQVLHITIEPNEMGFQGDNFIASGTPAEVTFWVTTARYKKAAEFQFTFES